MRFSDFNHIIKNQGFVILDGALATELEARSADLNHPLWSAKLLIEDPLMIRPIDLRFHDLRRTIIILFTGTADIMKRNT